MLNHWEKNDIFNKSILEREGRPSFTFYEGPPSANGTPGIHHVMARTVKDIFCRFQTMKNFQVKRKGGWDTHGLPVELQVEKELGITKEDIGKKISIKEYNDRCREAVMKYKQQWDELTEVMGFWVDLENPYVTFDASYIESVWHLLKQLYDKDLLYKGYTIQPYSPAAGTGLSSHELNQPGTYRDVKDTSVVAQFKVIRNKESEKFFSNDDVDVYLLAWTTTPWTLPANAALAVGKDLVYSCYLTFNRYTNRKIKVIACTGLEDSIFDRKVYTDFHSQESFNEYVNNGDRKSIPFLELSFPSFSIEPNKMRFFEGKELIGLRYEQLLRYVQPLEHADKAFQVIEGDFVSTEDGTGIVHISPTFGADDYRVAKAAGVPAILVLDEEGQQVPIVDRQGRFVKQVGEFAGMYVKNYNNADESDPNYKSTDVLISILLKEENKAFKVEKYEHSYPHCWRTDKPVLYYPLDSWFIRTTAYKDRMVELNKTINWMPQSTGTGRFGNWLENLVDWNLSRSRYWGTPLPIWVTEDRKEMLCIGSVEELRLAVRDSIKAGFMSEELPGQVDLHRPFVDEIILCSPTGKAMYRETDLVDVWFDSGAMPYAQWHYPFENEKAFRENFPADFIAEGVDQTRGWFFTLHALSVLLFDSVAYKNVIANGLVLDKNGNKMSKSKGNVVNPFDTIATYGPDPTRWYMIENAPPWDNLKFNLEGVLETQRKFFGTLSNTYSFFALYANLDAYAYMQQPTIAPEKRTEIDRWIISRLQSLNDEVSRAFSQYEPTLAARAIQTFVVDDLSNWYVRLNRKRFWKPGSSTGIDQDKQAAYDTLFECLLSVAQFMAPIAPFYADWLYLQLTGPARAVGTSMPGYLLKDSVHLTLWPDKQIQLINEDSEKAMHMAQEICSLAHALRKGNSLKVRQPLQKILVPMSSESSILALRMVEDLIKSEINVKEIEILTAEDERLSRKIKPNFKKLGKQYGPRLQEVAKLIQSFSQSEIVLLEKQGQIEAGGFSLSLEDVEIAFNDVAGWAVATLDSLTVALDLHLTPELVKEGIARELVNRIQNLRKQQNLEVTDKIRLLIQPYDQQVNEAIEEYKAYISAETQAVELRLSDQLKNPLDLEMDDFSLKVDLRVA